MLALQTLWSTVVAAPLLPVLLSVFTLVIVMLLVLTIVVMQLSSRFRALSAAVYDQRIKEAQEKVNEMLAQAREEGNAIRAKAQANADAIFADRKNLDETFRIEQSKHLQEITAHATELLNRQASVIAQHSVTMAGAFKKQAFDAEQALTREVETMKQLFTTEGQHVAQVFVDLAKKAGDAYDASIAETQKRLSDELTGEIENARKAMVQYKQERLRTIDDTVVELIEETARTAFARVLSLDEHRDIILAALTEAKQAGVFGSTV